MYAIELTSKHDANGNRKHLYLIHDANHDLICVISCAIWLEHAGTEYSTVPVTLSVECTPRVIREYAAIARRQQARAKG